VGWPGTRVHGLLGGAGGLWRWRGVDGHTSITSFDLTHDGEYLSVGWGYALRKTRYKWGWVVVGLGWVA